MVARCLEGSTDASTFARMAAALTTIGDPERARELAEQACVLDPELLEAHVALAKALQLLKDPAAMVAALRTVLRLAPDNAEMHASMAQALKDLGDLRGAAEYARRAIDLDPRAVPGHMILAHLLRMEQDFAGALEECRAVLAIDEDNVDALALFGGVLASQGKLSEGIEHLRRAVAIDPVRSGFAEVNLAVVLQQSGDLDGAIETLRRRAERVPADAFGVRYLSQMLKMRGAAGDAEEALDRLLAGREGIRENAADLNDLVDLLRQFGREAEALATAQQAAALESVDPQLLVSIGSSLSDLGDLEGARRTLQRAVDQNARGEAVHRFLGVTLSKLERRAEAARSFQRAIDAAGQDGVAMAQSAVGLARIGEYGGAREGLRRAKGLRGGASLAEGYLEAIDVLPKALRGESFELSTSSRRLLASLLGDQRHFVAAARQHEIALEEDERPSDQVDPNRFWAACAAALAGGEWHAKGLDWLTTELGAVRRFAALDPQGALGVLAFFEKAPELASLREASVLPARVAQFWSDVATLRRELEEASSPKKR